MSRSEGRRGLAGLFGFGAGGEPQGVQSEHLLEINKALVRETQPKRLYSMILDAGVELTGAERAFLILVSPSGEPHVEDSRTIDREEVKSPLTKVSHTVLNKVLEGSGAVLTDSAQDDAELSPAQSVADLKLRSILALPLTLRDEVVGCLYFDNRFQKGVFGQAHRELMERFADQASLAVDNARLHDENRRARQELERLNKQLEQRVEVQKGALETMQVALEKQKEKVALKFPYDDIVGRSPAMMELLRLMDVVIETDYPVLITGESGTGKEMVASAIHRNGARKHQPFVAENCAAIAENLLEAELFGYVRGAFTGADRDKKGLFEEADGGTLFLDEIGDMDPSMQRKLLRVLQEGEFRKVGGREAIHVDVRILSATNADLAQRLQDGTFREDLYYRLKVMALHVPPLRERRTDIPILVAAFLRQQAEELQVESPEVSPEAMALLMNYSWPGNVRELRNEVLRLAALAEGRIEAGLLRNLGEGIKVPHLPLAGRTLAELEKDAILQALEASRGKRVDAARMLGLPRRTFYNRLKRYGLG